MKGRTRNIANTRMTDIMDTMRSLDILGITSMAIGAGTAIILRIIMIDTVTTMDRIWSRTD